MLRSQLIRTTRIIPIRAIMATRTVADNAGHPHTPHSTKADLL